MRPLRAAQTMPRAALRCAPFLIATLSLLGPRIASADEDTTLAEPDILSEVLSDEDAPIDEDIAPYFSPFDSFAEALSFAENSFAFGDYERVVGVLRGELYPRREDAMDYQALDGFMYLGVAAHALGDREMTEEAFVEMLRIDAERALDPFVFPPDVIAFFESIREAHADEFVQAPTPAEHTVFIESQVREQSILVSMLPFGYGMIANGQTEWGVFYALSESALLATSVSMFWLNHANREPSESLTVGLGYADPDLARRRRRVHVITGGMFLGLLVTNVIHGAVAHDRGGEVRYRTMEEAPAAFDDLSSRGDAPRRPGRWSVRVQPIFEF